MQENEQTQNANPDDNKFYGMKYDIVFKKAFVENNDLLKRFISDMLDIPFDEIGDVIVSNPELVPADIDGKFSRLDIKAVIRNAIVNIEMTISRMPDYEQRTVYYWAGLYHDQPIKGFSYRLLKKTVSLNVLAYKAYPHGDYRSRYVIYDVQHRNEMKDILEIYFFELPKIMENPKTECEIRQNMWLETISADSEEKMNSLCGKYNDESVSKCAKVVTSMNADEKFREVLRAHEEAEIERGAMLYNAREQGRAEGAADTLISSIFNVMKSFGVGIEQAMKSLSVPESEYSRYSALVKEKYSL